MTEPIFIYEQLQYEALVVIIGCHYVFLLSAIIFNLSDCRMNFVDDLLKCFANNNWKTISRVVSGMNLLFQGLQCNVPSHLQKLTALL